MLKCTIPMIKMISSRSAHVGGSATAPKLPMIRPLENRRRLCARCVDATNYVITKLRMIWMSITVLIRPSDA